MATDSTTHGHISSTTQTKLYLKLLKQLLWRAQGCLAEVFLLLEWLVLWESASLFSLQTRDSSWMRLLFQELHKVRSRHQDIRNGPTQERLNGATLKYVTSLLNLLNLKLVQGKFPIKIL